MDNSQRAWELAMVLIANGKIPFDPANLSGSMKILARHLEGIEEALHDPGIFAQQAFPRARYPERTATERLSPPKQRRPSLARVE